MHHIWPCLPTTNNKVFEGRSSKRGSREIHEKTPSACANIGAVSHFQAQRGSDRSVPQEAPGCISQQCLTQPHRQHPEPGRMSSGPRPVSSHYRTQAPTETVLVGTVTAAKCKMEMARERMAPAAPSERLRSQNIPPRHTVHGSSHPPLPTTAGYWGVEWDTRKHLKEVITAHQLNRQLTPQDVFQVTLYLTIGHSPFYRFWVLLTLF